MPNYGHIAICPFYRAEKNKSISCEDTFRRFKNENKRNAWATMYCDSWDWMKCPYAADLTEAYERYEKGDGMALENHENEALRTELEKMSRRLGMAEKRCERQQKKIDELRAVNQSLVNVNENLTAQNKRIYKQWRELSSRNEAFEKKIFDQVQTAISIYSDRLCYMVDKYGELRDSEVEAWSQGKEYAVIVQKDGDDKVWKAVVREITEDGKSDNVQDEKQE